MKTQNIKWKKKNQKFGRKTGKPSDNSTAEELQFANELKEYGVFKVLKYLGFTRTPVEQSEHTLELGLGLRKPPIALK